MSDEWNFTASADALLRSYSLLDDAERSFVTTEFFEEMLMTVETEIAMRYQDRLNSLIGLLQEIAETEPNRWMHSDDHDNVESGECLIGTFNRLLRESQEWWR